MTFFLRIGTKQRRLKGHKSCKRLLIKAIFKAHKKTMLVSGNKGTQIFLIWTAHIFVFWCEQTIVHINVFFVCVLDSKGGLLHVLVFLAFAALQEWVADSDVRVAHSGFKQGDRGQSLYWVKMYEFVPGVKLQGLRELRVVVLVNSQKAVIRGGAPNLINKKKQNSKQCKTLISLRCPLSTHCYSADAYIDIHCTKIHVNKTPDGAKIEILVQLKCIRPLKAKLTIFTQSLKVLLYWWPFRAMYSGCLHQADLTVP